MSFEYTDLVRDVSDRTADDYQEYLDNLEPDEDAQYPWEFASDESLHENISDVLIPTHAIGSLSWSIVLIQTRFYLVKRQTIMVIRHIYCSTMTV